MKRKRTVLIIFPISILAHNISKLLSDVDGRVGDASISACQMDMAIGMSRNFSLKKINYSLKG